MEFVLPDFRWKSIAKKTGYLVVQFDNSMVNKKTDLKTMLHDFPKAVIHFMWEKYSQSEQAMTFVERSAKGDIVVEGKKKKVVRGFSTLKDYLEKMAWKDDAGPCMQQELPWDTKPNRKVAPTKGKDSTRGNQEQEGETTLDLDETGVLCGGIVTNTGENPDCTGEDEAVQEMAVESTDYEVSDNEVEACASVGLNHDWEEFATVAWVWEGQLDSGILADDTGFNHGLLS
jgi:hypothetical protein